ncbi:MAG: hypothetical protein H6706_09535 [Myxococcales bacterium]|nr:hypothetical protein [Myxococcales bacterium]
MNADLPGQTLPLDAGATLVVGAPIRHVDPLSWFLGRTSSGASAVIAVTMEPPAPRLDADAVERRLGALRGLALPGIAAPLGFGLLADGRLWLAWPQVSGHPLIEEVPEGADAPTLLLQALQALRRVHALGLGHGRLTLASIVVQRVPPAGWITQIVDLGVSRLIGEPPPDGGQAADRLAAIGLVRLALRGPAQRDRALAEGLRDLEKAHDLHGLAERVRRLVVPPSPVRRASRVAVVLLPGLLAAAAGAAGVLWWFGRGAPTEAPPDAIALGGTTFPDAAPVRAVLPPTRPEDAARPWLAPWTRPSRVRTPRPPPWPARTPRRRSSTPRCPAPRRRGAQRP